MPFRSYSSVCLPAPVVKPVSVLRWGWMLRPMAVAQRLTQIQRR